jgi:hypothetical protein
MLLPPPPGGPVIPAGLAPHGDKLTADLNQLITNPMAFCTAGIFARLRQSAGTQSLTSGAHTVINYDTVDEDPYGGWSAGNTPTRPAWSWQPPAGCSGWYNIVVSASLASVPSDAVLRPAVSVSGAVQYATGSSVLSTSAPGILPGSARVYLLGGVDYVQGTPYFASGSGSQMTSNTAGFQSLLQIAWESN